MGSGVWRGDGSILGLTLNVVERCGGHRDKNTYLSCVLSLLIDGCWDTSFGSKCSLEEARLYVAR